LAALILLCHFFNSRDIKTMASWRRWGRSGDGLWHWSRWRATGTRIRWRWYVSRSQVTPPARTVNSESTVVETENGLGRRPSLTTGTGLSVLLQWYCFLYLHQ
jgi:hypothetical protein